MLKVKTSLETELLIDAEGGKFVVICEFCRKPLSELIFYNKKGFCSEFCTRQYKQSKDIDDEFNRCSRIE